MRQDILALLMLGFCSNGAFADTVDSASKARICLSCHQPQHRLAAIPLLEGQPADYLYVQLKAYKDNTRADPTATMPSSAANLSDADMRDIAAFLSTQKVPSVSYQVEAAKAALGQTKAVQFGCRNCHKSGEAATGIVPRVDGQAVGYSMAQLQAFADGKRVHGVGSNAAPAVSLKGTDIEELANFFAQ